MPSPSGTKAPNNTFSGYHKSATIEARKHQRQRKTESSLIRGVTGQSPVVGVGVYWRAAMSVLTHLHTPCGAGYVGNFVPPYAAPIAPQGARPPQKN